MNSVVLLIKIGGAVADNEKQLTSAIRVICEVRAEGAPVVLVHGGGREITRNLNLLNEKPEFHEGLRVTHEKTLNMVEMTLSGSTNKKLTGTVNRVGGNLGIQAVGISGIDAMTLICRPISHRLGRVGKIVRVNTGLVEVLLERGYIPVVSPISMDENHLHYNVNADEAAGALASALKASRLIFLSNVPGVLDAQGNAIRKLNPETMNQLFQNKVVTEGMIPKLKACRDMLNAGVREVHICGWQGPKAFKGQITGKGNSGTILKQ